MTILSPCPFVLSTTLDRTSWNAYPKTLKVRIFKGKRFQSHVQTFSESPLPHFDDEPFMDNDYLCNKLESSTLIRRANTFVRGCRFNEGGKSG